jgi:hypothetical protein
MRLSPAPPAGSQTASMTKKSPKIERFFESGHTTSTGTSLKTDVVENKALNPV